MERPLPPPPRVTIDEDLLRWLKQIPDLVPKIAIYVEVLNPASINGNTVSSQTFTITGISAFDNINANASLTAGLQLLQVHAIADNVIEVAIWNSSGGAIDQASTTFNITTIR